MNKNNDYQGKRPDQVSFSEKVGGYAIIGWIVTVILLYLTHKK
jgi:hypothetical protein